MRDSDSSGVNSRLIGLFSSVRATYIPAQALSCRDFACTIANALGESSRLGLGGPA